MARAAHWAWKYSRLVIDRDLCRRQSSVAGQLDRSSTFCQTSRSRAFACAVNVVARASAYAGNDVSLRAARLSLSVQYAVAGDDLPSRNLLRRWAAAALANDAIVTLRFVDTAEGEALNRSYRHKSGPTNVLSFVYDDRPGIVHGDVVLCLPLLRQEADEQGKTLAAHCAHLVVHGMLHLQGYDHRRADEAARMEAREVAILAALGVANPYAARGTSPDQAAQGPPS
ncbi:MAG: rRNA maturation RNase YbeY [Betaproteobacteria bacterium]|nr:MAG: rRNA maturation RNase YbeY [Betaproteobacteria bacterium]